MYLAHEVVTFRMCTVALFFSYLDKELYEEAVRDYEKIYKMDKSRGTVLSKTFKLVTRSE